MVHVLIIDDDPKICLFFTKLIEQMGHTSQAVSTISDGLKLNTEIFFDLILLDLELPDGNGLQILPDLLKSASEPEVIIITGTGDVRGAKMAFEHGAWDYVRKPFLIDEVSLPITRALQYRKEKQAARPRIPLVRNKIVGESDALVKCLEDVANASGTDASVLITGETGTGKELFARAIHENSKRSLKSFVAVDCGALPETLVESTLFGHEKGAFTGAQRKQEGLLGQADGGTLMLDEVGDLPLTVQKAFLRTLQERTVRPVGGTKERSVDFRLVAATNLDLDKMVIEKRFREDLLYRIRAIEIKLPPLRDRGADIEEITIKKAHELAQRYGIETKAISKEFFHVLKAHHWPGNVRELINILEYALASAGQDPTLFPKHLPPEYRTARLDFGSMPQSHSDLPPISISSFDTAFPTLTAYRDQAEKKYLQELLGRAKQDRKKASEISGISQSRLYALLKKHHLSGFSNS